MNNSDHLQGLELSVIDTTAIIQFNRPAKRNSLTSVILNDLKKTVAALDARKEIKALILTGIGDVFASGADIVELSQLTPESAVIFSKLGQSVCNCLAESTKLTIAAINGFCMGGALDLAISCDRRIASRQAVFAHPGAKLGIITGWGGTQRLPRLIGPARALELFFTARTIESNEALKMGLIDEVYDPVLSRALELAAL